MIISPVVMWDLVMNKHMTVVEICDMYEKKIAEAMKDEKSKDEKSEKKELEF